MKRKFRIRTGAIVFILLAGLFCGITADITAMPPHQNLIERHKAGIQPLPDFALKSREEKTSQGIDIPSPLFAASKTSASGSYKALVVLVEFSDNAATTDARFFDTLVFDPGQVSIKNYYSTMSGGALSVDSVNSPSSIGWITAPQLYTYYSGGNGGTGTYPNNSQRLCEDVVAAIDGSVNFSQYDGNSDGYVDLLVIVHAGTGGESSGDPNDIWSHKWGITPQSHDGKYVYEYCIVPELWFSPGDMTIGVFCHEMGHLFGLPDLYDTDGSSNGVGKWSIMASGSWLGPSGYGGMPAAFDAWCRIQLGFNSYTNVTSNINGASVAAVISGGPIYRLWSSGAIGNQYYLVENRRKTGYDTYLPGEGLLIWHIDDSKTNNTKEWYPGYTANGNYQVALEQADNLFHLEQKLSNGDAGDPFPGSTINTSFAPGTSPSSNSYSGANTYVAITSISAPAATMTADFQVSLLSDLDDPNADNLPTGFALMQNYPNPFNPSTEIEFDISRASKVRLTVYNLLGQNVANLVDDELSAGSHSAVWDGRDDRGNEMSSGLYFYEIVTDFGSDAKKMLFLK